MGKDIFENVEFYDLGGYDLDGDERYHKLCSDKNVSEGQVRAYLQLKMTPKQFEKYKCEIEKHKYKRMSKKEKFHYRHPDLLIKFIGGVILVLFTISLVLNGIAGHEYDNKKQKPLSPTEEAAERLNFFINNPDALSDD